MSMPMKLGAVEIYPVTDGINMENKRFQEPLGGLGPVQGVPRLPTLQAGDVRKVDDGVSGTCSEGT